MKSRLLAPLSLCALLLAGCDGDWTVPETNTQDFRISFTEAEVTDSCVNAQDGEPEQDPTAMVRASDNFDPFEQIYRIHFPEGSEDPRFDLYWKHEGDRESDFAFFAAGTLQGTMEEGSLTYSGGAFQEERTDGRVTFEIDGRVSANGLAGWQSGHEDYIITESTNNEAYPVGCVFRLSYEGQPLAAQGDAASDEGDEG